LSQHLPEGAELERLINERIAVRGPVDPAGEVTPVGEDIEAGFFLQSYWK